MNETPITPESQQQIRETARHIRNTARTATAFLVVAVLLLYFTSKLQLLDFVLRRGPGVETPILTWSFTLVSFLYLILLLILIYSTSACFQKYLRTESASDLEEALAAELLLWRFFLPFVVLAAITVIGYFIWR